MTDPKKKPSLRERFEELDLAVPLQDEEAEEILQGAGIDADLALARLLKRVETKEAEVRSKSYAKAAAERRRLLDRLEDPKEARPRAELLAIIAREKARGVQVQAMYKNLDEVTDEDLESLVSELELLAEDDEET